MKAFNISATIVFIAVVGIIVYNVSLKERQNFYSTVNPTIMTIEEKVYIPGNVYPIKEIEIKSHISGFLEDIKVEVGDFVGANTPVAAVRMVSSSSEIESLESTLNIARIEYEQQQEEYIRNTRLLSTGTISQSEYEAIKKTYLVAEERYNTARTQLDILKTGSSTSKEISNIILSSTKGMVIDIPLEEGASVIERNNYNAGTTVVVLADMTKFVFRTLISEQYLKYIDTNTVFKLAFNAYDSLQVNATVNKISSKGTTSGNGMVQYSVDAFFDITPEMPVIRSGYSATAEICFAKKENVISIAEKNIRFSNDSVYVFLLDSITGKPKKHLIDVGISDGINAEILSGLSLESKVVTDYFE